MSDLSRRSQGHSFAISVCGGAAVAVPGSVTEALSQGRALARLRGRSVVYKIVGEDPRNWPVMCRSRRTTRQRTYDSGSTGKAAEYTEDRADYMGMHRKADFKGQVPRHSGLDDAERKLTPATHLGRRFVEPAERKRSRRRNARSPLTRTGQSDRYGARELSHELSGRGATEAGEQLNG